MFKLPNGISFYVITRNESSRLEKCLNSIHKIVDEIIVIDSKSTDSTIKIAEKFKARIYKVDFKQSLSELRNYAISKAHFSWILTIDADEILSQDLKKILKDLITSNNCEGYWFSRRHYLNQTVYLKYGYFYPDYQLRLFKNNRYRYSGRLHEHLNIPLQKTKHINQDIYHFAKNPKYDSLSRIKKLNWHINLQSKNYLDDHRNLFYYLFMSIFSIPYHFIGSFVRGKGYKDGQKGFIAAIVFAQLLSYAYFVAFRKKISLK